MEAFTADKRPTIFSSHLRELDVLCEVSIRKYI